MILEKHEISVGITGTHGKTTITAMASFLFEEAGLNPTVIIGGESPHFGGNAKNGPGKTIVAEVDESDGRFASLKMSRIIIPNLEKEHLEYYTGERHLLDTFAGFFKKQARSSRLFYGIEDRNLRKLAKYFKGRSVSFGFSKKADIRATGVEIEPFRLGFDCFAGNRKIGRFELGVPGVHNIIDALAAIALGLDSGIDVRTIKRALKKFKGVKRRFEVAGSARGVTVVEDYAHHPTEIKATLQAARSLGRGRIITVFQPHRYSRTLSFYREFARSFSGSERVFLTDVYSASEKRLKGSGTERIHGMMLKEGRVPSRLLKKERIPARVSSMAKAGDLVLVLGAGDINRAASEILKELKKKKNPEPGGTKARVLLNEPLSRHTAFGIGGPCRMWAAVSGADSLCGLLRFARKRKNDVFVIGKGSNVLVNDSGFPGIVIRLEGGEFIKLKAEKTEVTAGAAVSLNRLVRFAREKGLTGLEGLAGIPGTVGGAVFMNAGQKENISECLKEVKAVDRKSGKIRVIKKKNINFGYRHSAMERYIIMEATFFLKKFSREKISKKIEEILRTKRKNQPLKRRSAGCVFKNPENGPPAAKYIDILGLKGRAAGGAMISGKHANFIVNTGGATAGDVLSLMKLVRRRVRSRFGVDLESEIKII